MSLADKFNLLDGFNVLRIVCAVFFVPHLVGKFTVPAVLKFYVDVGFKQPAAWCDSHNLCLRADLTGRQLEAAKRFVMYLSDHSLDWAAGGQIPIRKSLRRSTRFQQMYAQREFAQQIPYAAYMPSVPYIFEYRSEFDLAIERALHGSASPQSALDTAAKNITKVMKRYQREGLS